MTISPQLGHENFVASSPGGMIRLQEVHVGIEIAGFSLIGEASKESRYRCYSFICAVFQ